MLQMSASNITILVGDALTRITRGGLVMSTGAQARRDDVRMPSLELNEKLLEILEGDPEQELSAEILSEIVTPMIKVIQQLVRENPDQAKKGLKVTIDVKSHESLDVEYYTTAEVAEMYRMSQQQVRRWCESGQIKGIRSPGGSWRIDASQFEGVGFLVPKGRRKRTDIKSISGAWKDNAEARRELGEVRD